jgi:hypothetical protein
MRRGGMRWGVVWSGATYIEMMYSSFKAWAAVLGVLRRYKVHIDRALNFSSQTVDPCGRIYLLQINMNCAIPSRSQQTV